MKFKKEKILMILFIIIYVLYIVSFFVPSLNNIIEGNLMYIIFIACFIAFVLNSTTIINTKNFILFFLFLVCFIFSIIFKVSGIGSYINALNLILITIVAKKTKLSSKNYIILFKLSIALLITLWIKSLFVWNNFVLNIDDNNPNTIAQEIVLCYGIVCFGLNFFERTKKNKILFIITTILTLISLVLCQCRTALIIFAFYIFASIFKNINKFIDEHFSKIIFIFIILGIIFPYVYVYLYKNSINISLPFVSAKSFFTGREKLWKLAIETMNFEGPKSYILGLGSHHVTSIGVITNFHNWYLGMIYYFGVPFMFFYFLYLVNNYSKLKSIYIKITVMSFFLFGFTETSALWAKSQFIVLILLLFSNCIEINQRY